MQKKINELLQNTQVLALHGDDQLDIEGLAYDSRTVKNNYLFFALPGLHVDGKKFIAQAIKAGARAIVYEGAWTEFEKNICYIQVASSRFAMSPIAANFYEHPSKSLITIGVTATEGKSTTVYLIYQLLKLCGERAGFFSTVGYDIGRGEEANPEHQTTPEAITVQAHLAAMRDAGYTYAVVEASSHGLSPKTNRLGDVKFDVGVCLNVTHEHLEFHGSWEQYRHDKANLFRALDRDLHNHTPYTITTSHHAHAKAGRVVPSFAVYCADDPSYNYFVQSTQKKCFLFSSKNNFSPSKPIDAEIFFRVENIKNDEAGSSYTLCNLGESARVRLELPGAFNVDNATASLIVVATLLQKKWTELIPLLQKLQPVIGRMTRVDEGQNFEVIVDYAHTPSSFMAILPSIRARAPARVIALFGSGGERDTKKRPEQGRIAAEYCDILILADEDPRGEDPVELLEMIAAGCPQKIRGEELFIIPHRPTAIKKAFALARPKDIVLLLGKGHENSIIGKTSTVPYSEIDCAKAALRKLLGKK